MSAGVAGQLRRSHTPSMTLWRRGVAVGFSTTRPVKMKVAALKRRLDEFKAGEPVIIQIERAGRLMFVTLELE